MKKIFFNTLLCAAALILGISCSKIETGKIEPQLEDCSVSADVLGADTKVALSGNTPQWQSGDKILVFGTDGKLIGSDGLFTLETGAGSNSGTFKGTKYFGQTPAYAIYPASVYNKATGKFTLPTAQDGTETTAFKSYAVMMGAIDGSQHIDFKNVCSIVKLNTGDYGKSSGEAAIKSVKLSAATSALTGEFTPNWTNNTIAPVADGASQEVTATAANAETGYAANTNIYIPVFPVASQSISIKFANTKGKVATVSETFAPAVNKIKDLGIAGGMEFIVDPDLWVNLGMVSANGYPLYISKRNVARVENGVAYFTDSEDELGTAYGEFEIPKIISSEDGLDCRILNYSELWAMSKLGNADITFDVLNNCILTSKLNPNKLVLPVYSTGTTRYFLEYSSATAELVIKNNSAEVIVANSASSEIGVALLKLVYEDKTASRQSYKDNTYTLYTHRHYNDVPRKLELNGTENFEYDFHPTFLTKIEWANGYLGFYQDVPYGFSFDLAEGQSKYELDGVYLFVPLGIGEPGFHAKINVTFNSHTNYFYWRIYYCFVKGTLITLADGSRKKVEDLTYDDELLVWNFDKGCLDSAKPLWLKKSEQSGYYYKVTLSDGTEINLVGSDGNCHRLFNYTDKVFQYPTRMAVGTKIYTENGIATLVSCERIEEETEFYNLITDKHINCFADGVLASCRYNNLYPIDEDMKFVKDGRKKRPYKEFKAAGISREWYNGLRLGEQTDSLADITEYINERVAIEQPKPAPTFWQRIKTWWKSIFG